MKYFLHDSNAFNDEKITMIYMKYGFEGLGLFYTILEKLAAQEKPVLESVLKTQLNIRKKLEKQLHFMYEINVLSLRNGCVFNENLLNFSEKYQIKKEKNRKRISEWREKQIDTNNVTCYEHVRNTPKVKESKVKESKEKNKIERENDFNEKVKKLVSELKDSKFWTEKNILNFCNYWTQANDNSEKMHFEKQKTFDLKKRLAFWESNSYNQNKKQEEVIKPIINTEKDYERLEW